MSDIAKLQESQGSDELVVTFCPGDGDYPTSNVIVRVTPAEGEKRRRGSAVIPQLQDTERQKLEAAVAKAGEKGIRVVMNLQPYEVKEGATAALAEPPGSSVTALIEVYVQYLAADYEKEGSSKSDLTLYYWRDKDWHTMQDGVREKDLVASKPVVDDPRPGHICVKFERLPSTDILIGADC